MNPSHVRICLELVLPWRSRGGFITGLRHLAEYLGGRMETVEVLPAPPPESDTPASKPPGQPERHLTLVR